jgi:uncharacterized metal-binding protein YceD (DUF177 family)
MSHERMILRLAALPPGHSVQHGRVGFVGLDAAGDEVPFSLEVECQLDNLASRVHVRGDVHGTARSICHRCLAEFERAVAASFVSTLQRGGRVESDDDVVAVPETAAEYDITESVREAVILEEPIQALCRPDCRGLCPRCGADRNTAECGCEPAPDPRWDALGKLRRQL